jgi:ankyrin repeat protein
MDAVDQYLDRQPSLVHERGVHDLPPLYFAAIGGSVDVAKRVIEAGADVNARADAAASIHGAVMSRKPEMVALLIAHDADPSARDYQGRSARALAEALGEQDIAKLLEERR